MDWKTLFVAVLAPIAGLGGVWLGTRQSTRIAREERADAKAVRDEERAARAADAARQSRAAARLVLRELRRALAALRYQRTTGQWWHGAPLNEVWTRDGRMLAVSLDDAVWVILDAAYDWIEAADQVRLRREDVGPPQGDDPRWFEVAEGHAAGAIDLLEKAVGLVRPDGMRLTRPEDGEVQPG